MSAIAEAIVVPELQERASKIVWALAWPAVALNSLQVVNTLLDRGFIGHLQAAASTAQGASMNVMFLTFSLAMSLGTAATALVSRAYGAGQVEEFRMAGRQSLSVAIIGGLILASVSVLITPFAAASLLPANDFEARRLMVRYLLIYSAGLPAIYLIQALAGSLRAIGDTKSPMMISGIQILLHMVLNFVLIFPPRTLLGGIPMPGFDMGLAGASLAMTISAWISAIVYLVYSGKTPLGEAWRISIPMKAWMVRILRIALPAAAMSVLRVASLTAFTLVLAKVPNASAAIAAMAIGFGIESIMFMPSFGLSVASAALVGQSLGMKRPDRAERMGWVAAHHAALVTLGLSLPIFFFTPGLVNLLVAGKPEIASESIVLIRYLCVTEIFFAYAMVMIGAMQGAGDTVRPMWITVVCMWALRVPLAYIFALPLKMGAVGAWLAMSLTQGVQGILSVWMFKQGRWKYKNV